MERKMGEKTKFPMLNPDGTSVKGCNYIYAPRGQAGEYAPLAANPYRGCGHRCLYCYVPNVIKMSRGDFDAGATPRKNFLVKLRKDATKYKALGIREQVMFSFTTDVYNPFDTSITRPAIEIIIEHGLAFCVLTKAGMRAWCDHDLYRPDRDAFASTLTSLDERFSRKWERNAAPRLTGLKRFAGSTNAEFSPGLAWSQRSASHHRSPSLRRRTALSICTRLAASTICQ
jgi:DNA repair photolyase